MCSLPVALARSFSGGVVICYVVPVLWMFSYNWSYGGVTYHRCVLCMSLHSCCVVLVASCPNRCPAPRLDESFVQGVSGQSM